MTQALAGMGLIVGVKYLAQGGEIVQTVAQRPRAEVGNALTTWVGAYRDYEDLGGVRVPTRGAVRCGALGAS